MNVLIVGSGGREHALAWKARQSAQVDRVFIAPGNAGTAAEPGIDNVDIAATDITLLIDFAKHHAIDFTIVGPETPLANGIVDQFTTAGLACFGPTQRAAQLEASKDFSKDFMSRHHIPTAAYRSFRDAALAKQYVDQMKTPIVIKADGLAAGKGVVIAQTRQQAFDAIDEFLLEQRYGEASCCIVIEEFLEGEEVSFIVVTDGEHAVPLATSQDHKRRDDHDQGPNTGGMGAYSPAPFVDAATEQQILEQVIQPTIKGLAHEGIRYCGFLYAGLMILRNGELRVLEFNCRMGDPETQPIMMRMKSDLVALCLAAHQQRLAGFTIDWDPRVAVGVVVAAGGYPDQVVKGDVIALPATTSPHTKIFHAATALQGDHIITAGGRVLCATALGDTTLDAQRNAYQLISKIHFNQMFFRHDIAQRALNLR